MVFLRGISLHTSWGPTDPHLAQLHGFSSGYDFWAALLLSIDFKPAELPLFLILLGPASLPREVLLIVILEA